MLEFVVSHAGSLERRRFPRGRWVCQGELKPWHLSLEQLGRELDLTRDEHVRLQLRGELEDILMQHVRQPSSLETRSPYRTQTLEETA
jgi:hypothetical protein